MGTSEQRTIIYAPLALDELGAIWQRNATTYGVSWADNYVQFLKAGIDNLAATADLGRPVRAGIDWKYRLLRRRTRGHGHVVVYRILDDNFRALHVFHSSQDWRNADFDD